MVRKFLLTSLGTSVILPFVALRRVNLNNKQTTAGLFPTPSRLGRSSVWARGFVLSPTLPRFRPSSSGRRQASSSRAHNARARRGRRHASRNLAGVRRHEGGAPAGRENREDRRVPVHRLRPCHGILVLCPRVWTISDLGAEPPALQATEQSQKPFSLWESVLQTCLATPKSVTGFLRNWP